MCPSSPCASAVVHSGTLAAPRARVRVLVAYWLVSVGSLGVQYVVAGALYVDLLADFRRSRAATALVGAVCVGVQDGGAVLAGVLMTRCGERAVGILGAVLVAAGFMSGSFASELEHVIVAVGGVVGLGFTMVLYVAVVVTNRVFADARSAASAAANTGASVGLLVLANIWRISSRAYGWRGVLRGFAVGDGLMLLVAVAFLLPWGDDCVRARAPKAIEPATQAHETAARRPGCCSPYVLCLVATVLASLGSFVAPVHLVQLARDSGHGTASADGLLVLLAFGGLSLRIPINLAADRFGRSRAFGVICLAYSGALTAIAVAPRLLHVLQAASFVCGGMLGSLFSLLPTIVPGVVPPSRVVLATTAQMSFAGVGLFLGPVLVGMGRDLSGTYTSSFLASASVLALGGALLSLLVPLPAGGGRPSAALVAPAGA